MDLKTSVVEVLAENVAPNDLVVTAQGWAYFTDTGKGEVIGVEIKSKKVRTAASGITAPNGIALSPDETLLFTANGPSTDVSVVAVASGTVIRKVKAGDRPWGVIALPRN